MKIQSQQNEVLTNLTTAPHDFRIKQSAAAFQALSSSLYKKPVDAIIRELSCNAYDAHKVAGVDRPFQVHLPNTLEPWFSIRDFGHGLSPQEILEVYTVYFESTKGHTNDLIGGYGLGCKTPFSYTSAFTITSFHKGTRTEYSAFVGEAGTPQIQKLTEAPCQESGLLVKIPVKSFGAYSWRNDWEAAAQYYLPYFDPKPSVNITLHHNSEKGSLLGQGSTWKLYKNNHHPIVVIGQVPYELEISKLDLPEELGNKLGGFEFYAAVGDVDPTVSREAIQYNPRSITNLKALVTNAYDEFTKEIRDDVANLTYWEACKKYGNSPYKVKHPSGKLVLNYIEAEHTDNIFLCRKLTYSGTRLAGASWTNGVHVKPEHTECVYVDSSSRLAEKALYLLKDGRDRNSTILFFKDLAALNSLGNPPYQNASQIILPKKPKSTTPSNKKRAKYRNLGGNEIEVDLTQPGLYVVTTFNNQPDSLLRGVVDLLPKLLDPMPQVAVIPQHRLDTFLKKASGWKLLRDEAKRVAENRLNPEASKWLTFCVNNNNHPLANQYINFFSLKSSSIFSKFKPSEEDKVAFKILTLLDQANKLPNDSKEILKLYDKLPNDLKLYLTAPIHHYTNKLSTRYLQLIKELP